MKVQAAICWEPGRRSRSTRSTSTGPKAGECLVRLAATGVCHTDAYTMSGRDPSGLFPAVLGHEGAGVVEEVGPGRHVARRRRPRDPALHPRVPQLQVLSVAARRTSAARSSTTQGKGLMPDGTSRLSHRGRMLHHYMGTSTFAKYTVVPEIALAKIRKDAPLEKVCLLGCGVTTGIGAVLNTAKVQPGSQRRRLRPRRHRPLGHPGRGHGGRRAHHRRSTRIRRSSRWRRQLGATDTLDPTRGRRRRRGGRRDDRRRRRLLVRVHRQRRGDGPGAGVRPQGLGPGRSSSASPAPARRSTRVRSCW